MKISNLAKHFGIKRLGFLLGLLIVFSLKFAQMAKADNYRSGFDHAVERIGGIKRGDISYLKFSDQFNPRLDAAIKKTFSDLMKLRLSDKTYSYTETTIHGKKLAFVLINNSYGAGSGGSHTWVFQGDKNGYKLVHIFGHQISLVILPTSTSGWPDIFVVPGKLFNPNYGADYYQCSYNPTEKFDNRNKSYDRIPNHYRNCQKVRDGSQISGIVVNTSFPRNYPKFNLE